MVSLLLFNTLGQHLTQATTLLMCDKGQREVLINQLAKESMIKVQHLMENGSSQVTQQSVSVLEDLKKSEVLKPTCYSMNFCRNSRSMYFSYNYYTV